MTSNTVENRNLLVQKKVLGAFQLRKKLSCHFSPNLIKKHVRDLVKRFQHGFQSWIKSVRKNILMHNTFFANSDFYYQFGTLNDNIMQLLATGVSACQSKVHSTLPDKLFEGKNFLGKCKYVKCKKYQAKLFWQDRQNCFLHLQWTVKKKSSLFGKNHLYVIAFTP